MLPNQTLGVLTFISVQIQSDYDMKHNENTNVMANLILFWRFSSSANCKDGERYNQFPGNAEM